MTDADRLDIDTEAILAELRAQASRTRLRHAPEEARSWIRRYYAEFAELRQVNRMLDILRERWGVCVSRNDVQQFISKQ